MLKTEIRYLSLCCQLLEKLVWCTKFDIWDTNTYTKEIVNDALRRMFPTASYTLISRGKRKSKKNVFHQRAYVEFEVTLQLGPKLNVKVFAQQLLLYIEGMDLYYIFNMLDCSLKSYHPSLIKVEKDNSELYRPLIINKKD